MSDLKNPYAGLRTWTAERRPAAGLDRLDYTAVEVIDKKGLRSFNLNTILIGVAEGLAGELEPFEQIKSICSGAPAVLYRTREAEIALTPDEVERLVLRALTPAQFEAIVDAVGATWDLHGDFYDPETGESWQPKGKFFVDPDEPTP